ncbi:hypothetical protein AAG570_012952 [Ranatra chinensis]|uniref:Endonuclease/exonuclease/phosphatase domain-containing protein n=1 Tax=Ranatra chinensis TaxID=642074 RepID=A0ABD0YH86_9HEMI
MQSLGVMKLKKDTDPKKKKNVLLGKSPVAKNGKISKRPERKLWNKKFPMAKIAKGKNAGNTQGQPPIPHLCLQRGKKEEVGIHGLTASAPAEEILENVRQTLPGAVLVIQMTKTDGDSRKRVLPKFILITNAGVTQKEFKNLVIYSHYVQVQKYTTEEAVTQLYKCRLFGHSSRYCNLQQKCVRCAGNHRASECDREKVKPKYANCNKAHNLGKEVKSLNIGNLLKILRDLKNTDSGMGRIEVLLNRKITKLDCDVLHDILSEPQVTVVAGDFNAKHTFWNCSGKNPAGTTLYKFIEANRYVHLSVPTEFTHFPDNGNSPSTLDLVLTNRGHKIA